MTDVSTLEAESRSTGSALLVADMRSPHAQSWVPYLEQRFGHVIVLSSAHDGQPSRSTDPVSATASALAPLLRGFGSDTVQGGPIHWSAVQMRHRLGLTRAWLLARRIREITRAHPISHVHALRIPWEGVAVALAAPAVWTVTTWGSDLTAQAPQSHTLRVWTKRVLREARGLTADCLRDLSVATRLGFSGPSCVVPGELGIPQVADRRRAPQTGDPLRVVCPRGLLPHVRWKELILAVDLLAAEGLTIELTFIDVRRASPKMHGPHVAFLPRLAREAMLALARESDVVVSPCTSDGIPNSVLEFMSQGCVPVLGDIQSSREVVREGRNGFLCDPMRPTSIADALRKVIDLQTRRTIIANNNYLLLSEYSRRAVYARLDDFFADVRGDLE